MTATHACRTRGTVPATRLDVDAGTDRTVESLVPEVYEQLRRRARRRIGRLGSASGLTATELVHEAYLRVASRKRACPSESEQLLFVLNRAMRDVLVEKLRSRACLKRGRGRLVELCPDQIRAPIEPEDARHLRLALGKLYRQQPDCARVVLLSYFDGLTHPEIAVRLGVSRATVERRWKLARQWLRRQL